MRNQIASIIGINQSEETYLLGSQELAQGWAPLPWPVLISKDIIRFVLLLIHRLEIDRSRKIIHLLNCFSHLFPFSLGKWEFGDVDRPWVWITIMGRHGEPGFRLLDPLSHQSFPAQLSVSPEEFPGFVSNVLPLHSGLYGVGCLPPLAQPHDGLVQPQHLPPCPRHFHFLKVFRISGVWFTEGPLPYAFFEYFFTTQSASMTALSIICSTRSGSSSSQCCSYSFLTDRL